MRLPLVVFLASALSGCALLSDDGNGKGEEVPPPRPGSIQSELRVKAVWGADSGSGSPSAAYTLVPAVAEGRAYLADADGTVTALDALSGKRIWRSELEDRTLTGGPGAGQTVVAVGTRDGKVIGLDPASGETLWISGVTSEVLAVPRVVDDTVVVRSADGRVFGLAADSGRRKWIYQRSLPALTLRGTSSPAQVPGGVLVGLDTGRLVALTEEEGKAVWEVNVAVPQGRSEVERMVDVDADPVAYQGEAYAAAYQGRLVAVDMRSGRGLWSRELSSHRGLAVDAERVYLSGSDNRIWGLDRRTGASVWRNEELRGLQLTGPAVYDDYLVVGDSEGYLNWLSAEDGRLLARVRLDGAPIHHAPVVVDGLVYALGADGEMKVYTVSR